MGHTMSQTHTNGVRGNQNALDSLCRAKRDTINHLKMTPLHSHSLFIQRNSLSELEFNRVKVYTLILIRILIQHYEPYVKYAYSVTKQSETLVREV